MLVQKNALLLYRNYCIVQCIIENDARKVAGEIVKKVAK